MFVITFLLFLASIAILLIGLIVPNLFKPYFKNFATRKGLGLIFGTTIVVFFILMLLTTTPSSSTKSPSQVESSNQPAKQVDNQKPQELSKVISYEIVDSWSIPNGGFGKSVVISKEYLNEADMTAVGEKLKDDVKNDRNAFIFVFTDKKAASLRDKVLTDELSEKDRDFYDINYVGQYTKNGNSGFNEFTIYFDGVLGNNQKTIKY